MGLVIMNVFSNTLDTLLVFYFLVKVLNKKNIDKKRATVLLVSLIFFNTLINSEFGLVALSGFIVILIVSAAVYSYILEEGFFSTLIYSIFATILMGAIEIVSVMAIALTFKILPSMMLEINVYRVLAIILAKLSLYLIIKHVIYKLRIPRFINFKYNKSIGLISFFNMLIIFMTLTLYKYMEEKSLIGYGYLTSMGIGAIIFSWAIYTTTKKSIYNSQQEIIWKMKEEEFYKKDFYIKNMNDILQTIKSQRHELNNYLSTLYGLIYLESFDDAKKYIRKINDRITNMNSIIETNHPVITALISMKRDKASKDGIDMSFHIDLPEDLKIDSFDLSIIVGNLLNNGMEACLLVDKEAERKVQLSMKVEEESLLIDVKNTKSKSIRLDTKEIFGRFTTKEDKENHGFGLSNVDFIVKQYNGSLDLEDLGREFRVNITLPIRQDEYSNMKSTTHTI